MSQLILDPVLSGYNLAKVNDNFKRIEEAFNTLLLHKDGSKALTNDLDVNSQKLLNVGGIEIGGVDLLDSIVSLQETYNAYISEMETYRKAVEGILEEAISYGAVDKKSIGNSQAIFTTSQAYAKNSNLTLPLKYIVGKNTLSLSLGHTYLLYKGVDYEEVGVVGEESQTIKILRASGIGIGSTIEQVVDGDNDLYSIFSTASSLQTLLTTSYPPNKIEAFINSVSDVKELRIEDKISELWDIYNNLSALQVSFANIVADVNTKYSTITDMYEDIGTKYSVLETLYPQLVELIADTNFDLNGLNAAIGDLLPNISRLEGLTNTIESNAQTASTAATSASTSAGEASNNASIASASATKAQIWAEGTDTEVEGLLGEHSSKGWAEEAKKYATGNIIEALGYTPADTKDLTTEKEERVQADSSLQDALNALDDSVVKHTEQTLTSTQQAQVRTNIGAVSSAELTTGLATKQDVLTFDAAPTSGSSNPVTSDGIKTAIDAVIPSQTGNAGRVLTTDGTSASWQTVQSRNVCEYVWSALPLTDAGLHLLDGDIIAEGGIYDDFVQEVASLSVTYPDAFCTEAEWQASVNTYGSCGKFVYTPGTGVRLPLVSDILQGTTDVTAVGDLIEAGLPNIAGTFSAYSWGNDENKPKGAFNQLHSEVMNSINSGNQVASRKIGLDASLSSPIYGKSTTVQPQSIKALLYICVANSVKTQIQVNIDNIATDLNRKLDKSGATIERINASILSSDSGYIRYESGFQICWEYKALNKEVKSGGYNSFTWTYPQSFQSVFAVFVNSSHDRFNAGAIRFSSNTSADIYYVNDSTKCAFTINGLAMLAIGKWK